MVEDGKEILENAKKNLVVLLAYGDPYIATTHIELRTRAIQAKIKTKTIHGTSSITALVGECGLQFYKIGKIVTLMEDFKTMTTVYYTIFHNLLLGAHTILLMEYNQENRFFLKPNVALKNLLEIEKEQNRKVIDSSIFVIVASRIGIKSQKIICGKIANLIKLNFGNPPHTIIIPGRLHFTESDALKLLVKNIDAPTDNSKNVMKISNQMIKKYVPMVKEALQKIQPHYKNQKQFQTVLENAELYIQDAEKFLEKGQDEVAILSIGYADGLVDALRMAKGFEPKM